MNDDDFRQRARQFLEATCPPLDPAWDPPTGVMDESHDPTQPLREAVAFQRQLAAAGFAGLAVPVEYGGGGLDLDSYAAFAEEAVGFAVPSTMPLTVGLNLAVPVLLGHGSEEQRRALVPPTLAADLVWCQLFSEPDAGSDLASLRTTAHLVDGAYVADGQKVWSSFAQHATHGLLLARTDRDASRHRGLSLFAVRMDTPGIVVRPLREITGGTHFCEVFLDGVRIPAGAMIGAPGEGWAAAMSTLGTERRAPAARPGRARWERLADLANGHTVAGPIRHAIADVHVREVALELLIGRLDQVGGAAAGSLAKLGRTLLEQRASLLAAALVGPRSIAWEAGDVAGRGVAHWCVGARASSIAAGTDEIQRNLIAERLLGLPPEPR